MFLDLINLAVYPARDIIWEYSVLNVKALVGAFNQEKALVGTFSVIVKTGCGTDGTLHSTSQYLYLGTTCGQQMLECLGWWKCRKTILSVLTKMSLSLTNIPPASARPPSIHKIKPAIGTKLRFSFHQGIGQILMISKSMYCNELNMNMHSTNVDFNH